MNCNICKKPLDLNKDYYEIYEIETEDEEIRSLFGWNVHWDCFFDLPQSEKLLTKLYDHYTSSIKKAFHLTFLHVDSSYCITLYKDQLVSIKIKLLGKIFNCEVQDGWFAGFENQFKDFSSLVPENILNQVQIVYQEIKDNIERYNTLIEEEKRAEAERERTRHLFVAPISLRELSELFDGDFSRVCPVCGKKVCNEEYYFETDQEPGDSQYAEYYQQRYHWECLFKDNTIDNFLKDVFKKKVKKLKDDETYNFIEQTDEYYLGMQNDRVELYIARAAAELSCYTDNWLESLSYGLEMYDPYFPDDKKELIKKILHILTANKEELDITINSLEEKFKAENPDYYKV